MKAFLKKYWWGIIITVFAPVLINYLLMIPAIGPVVGDDVHWLAFWGSYLASLISAFVAFIILFIQRDESHQENDYNRKLQIKVLKYQQDMQLLSENRNILIDFSLSLNKDDLIELTNKMSVNQDILLDVKRLLANLVKTDSRVGFMRVSMETDSFKEYNLKRQSAFYTHRDTLLDIQEIYILFMRTSSVQRSAVLHSRMQQGFIHKGLENIILSYPSEAYFFQTNPVDIAIRLISSTPDLLEDTRKAALAYVKSEGERITKLLEDN